MRGRRRRNRAALGTRSRGRLTGERASSTIAPETGGHQGRPCPDPLRHRWPQFGRRANSTAGTGWRWLARRRCTVGLPPSTEVASSSNSRSSEPCSERCSSLDRTWHGLTVRAAARFTGGGSWGLISRNFVPLLTTLGWKIDLTLDGGSLTWIRHCLHPQAQQKG